MKLRHLAFSNLRRRKGKALLIVVGLSVAVGAFVLVLSLIFSLREAMNDKLSKYGSNLTVMPAGSELSLSYGGMSIDGVNTAEVDTLHEQDLEALRRIPLAQHIVAALPVLLQPVDVAGRSFLALGTDIPQSLKVKLWWKIEGSPPAGPDEALLGLNVRNELKAKSGDTLQVNGRSLRVAGTLLETGGEEDNAIIFDRHALEKIIGRAGEINLIEVTADNGQIVDQVAREIERALPDASVASVRKSIEFTNRANDALTNFGLAITVLIAAISGAVVAITLLMAIRERQQEIGVFRAVGYKQKHVAQLVFLETLVLSAIAAVSGVAIGLLGSLAVPRIIPALSVQIVLNPLVVAAGIALSFVIGVAATLYPARLAANLDPAVALKHV